MRRRLFAVLSAVSLPLCVTACALWVRSRLASDRVLVSLPPLPGDQASVVDVYREPQENAKRFFMVRTIGGQIELFTSAGAGTVGGRPRIYQTESLKDCRPRDTPRDLGFDWLYWGAVRQVRLVLPPWFVAAVFAVAPLGRYLAHRLRWTAAGLCSVCGYDLRATPERCPECGTSTLEGR